VLPTYDFKECTSATKAPTLIAGSLHELLVIPDVLSWHAVHGACWSEVKSKARPTYYRKLGRWEHGFDYSLLEEYERVERVTGVPVWIVVHEAFSPSDPDNDSPLQPANRWMVVRLRDAMKQGERRPLWPKRNGNLNDRGRHGMGGLLWPRAIMREMTSGQAGA